MGQAKGTESVWDYPRPPRLEPVNTRMTIEFGGTIIADATAGYRVLETSHPPTYYLPLTAFAAGALVPSRGKSSMCEFKGRAAYFDVVAGGRRASAAAWTYPTPVAAFADLLEHVAVYAEPMDRCSVGGETVEPQPGNFYGGWVTSWVTGPFKGGPGTMGW
ncbi:MAG: DUF427 domain-containing protein [Pseudomonadota bacterium]